MVPSNAPQQEAWPLCLIIRCFARPGTLSPPGETDAQDEKMELKFLIMIFLRGGGHREKYVCLIGLQRLYVESFVKKNK